MKTLVLIVPVLGVLLAACSFGILKANGGSLDVMSAQPQMVTPHAEEATLAAEPTEFVPTATSEPEPSPTLVTDPSDCPTAAKPVEQQLREVLISSGPLLGDTVTLQIKDCKLVGTFTFEKVNEYQRLNPTADPSSYPTNPKRELRIWEAQHGLPQDSTRQIYIEWETPITGPTDAVCQVLEVELNCYD